MLYRILTEDKKREQVLKLVERYCDSATIIQGKGLWQGQWENTLIIEIDNECFKCFECIKMLAEAIKELNKQEAILIQQIDCTSYLI